ncbi:MAG: hypothetical protein GDA49_04735 [Rhodospirillales bacterium]|nr:hypothetical protein [Rhodospirillales bacterium]
MERPPATIKAIVIGLALAIVGLTVILVYGIISKAGEGVASGGSGTGSAGDYADVAVALPAGARVTAISVENDALSLLVELENGARAVMTVDRRTGEVLGTLELLSRSE